jgi:ribosomal-protein-alanine N-acetyltransferase
MTVSIRAARQEDAVDLARLHHGSFMRAWSPEEFAALLERPDTLVPAAVQDGYVVGFAVAMIIAGEAELLTLVCAPGLRRRGIARALMGVLGQEASRRGAGCWFLEVATDNAAARALYEALGFAEVGRRPGYYPGAEGPVDALVMRCDAGDFGGQALV